MTTDSPPPHPSPPSPAAPPTRPKDPDWDDYWAHKIAEKAKSRILAYFGAATVVLTLVGLKGLDEVRKGIEQKFEEQIARKEKEASDKVSDILVKFEKDLAEKSKEVAQRREQFLQATVLPPEYRVASSATSASTTVAIDLSAAIGKIRDQGNEGATVGFSVAYAMQAAIKKQFNRNVELSARGLYTLAKKYDEWPGEAYEGTSVNGALKAAQTQGAYLESVWPYAGAAPAAGVKPTYRLVKSHDLGTKIEAINAALQAGQVPIVQITITSDFDTPTSEGRVIVRTPLKELGGHTMAVVGFDPAKAEFKLANMWGTGWGAKGFALVRDTDLKKVLVSSAVIDEVTEYR